MPSSRSVVFGCVAEPTPRFYEQALRQVGKDPIVVVYSRKRRPTVSSRDLRGPRPVVFKLHGDFSRPETLVITENDYIDFVGQMTACPRIRSIKN